METWLSNSGLRWERRSGVFVSNTSKVAAYDDVKRRAHFGYSLTSSEVGCFMAHQNCWRYCVESGLPMLILESDVYLDPEHHSSISHLIDSLIGISNAWDIVRLHGIFERNEKLTRVVEELYPPFALKQCFGDPMGAGAYLVTPGSAAALLEASASFYQPVDVFLACSWMHKQRYRNVKPYPFSVRKFESTIGERRRPKQGIYARLKIELNRAADDLKRLAYAPWDYLRK